MTGVEMAEGNDKPENIDGEGVAPAAPVSPTSWKDEAAKINPKKIGRGVETVFRTSYRVHMELSSLADTKANIMISINGIIISIIIASISPKIDTNPWLLAPTSVLLLACLISIVYAVRSARPRVSSEVVSLDDIRQNRANILFFGHFVSLSQDDYLTGMTELMTRPDVIYTQMVRDIYGLGKVLKLKFELLRVAYTVFMIGLSIGILLFILVYIWIVMYMEPVLA
ncbi:MAG: hypothetical protein ACI80V_000021 [Rhodothermales bacterium]|jgi:hypothetical protein